ncbi:MAG: hypothetical protein H0X62_04110 [Bacteroidetes bacterium]|nr:hypothetical protein [Bacteroidota bacterium]
MKKETRPALRTFEGSTLEKIEAYLVQTKEEIVLTKAENEILARYETALGILRGRRFPRTEQQCVKMLCRIFKISPRQARMDVNATQKIFGGVMQSNKAFKRHMASEWAVKAIETASKEGKIKEFINAIKLYAEVNGLDQDDPDVPDAENYRPSKYELHIHFKGETKPVTFDFNNLGNIEEAQFEEIVKTVEDMEIDEMEMRRILMDEHGEQEA